MSVAKVLVVGAGEAGKSTLIQALSPGAMNLEVEGRTVAMDHGVFERNGRKISLVGVPGQKRFEIVRETLVAGSRVVIWVHRAGFEIDSGTLGLVKSQSAPYLVYINHHRDDEDQLDWSGPDGVPPPAAVVAGNLRNPGGSLEVLTSELERLVQEDDPSERSMHVCLPHLKR